MIRRLSVWLLAAAAAACGTLGVYGTVRLSRYARTSDALGERSRAEGAGYLATLSNEYVESQLATFDRRRELLAETAHWRRVQLLAFVGLVFFGFAGYVARALGTIREMEDDLPLPPAGGRAPEKTPAH